MLKFFCTYYLKYLKVMFLSACLDKFFLGYQSNNFLDYFLCNHQILLDVIKLHFLIYHIELTFLEGNISNEMKYALQKN